MRTPAAPRGRRWTAPLLTLLFCLVSPEAAKAMSMEPGEPQKTHFTKMGGR
jgi:hypothetical protein